MLHALWPVLASTLLAPATIIPPAELDTVLHRAANRLALPGAPRYTQREIEESLDEERRTTSVRVTWSEQRILPNGGLRGDILRATEDGEDVTANARRELSQREQAGHGGWEPPVPVDLELRVPFEASQQARYRFTLVGGTPDVVLIAFEPRGDQHRLWTGRAQVDVATGTILEIAGRPAVLPHLVDQIDVRLEFLPTGPLGSTPARVRIEGQAHFLFIHRHLRYTSVISAPLEALDARAVSP